MKLKIAAIMISACIALSSCNNGISKGYVYDKQYYPGHTTYIPGHTSESCSYILGITEEPPPMPHEIACHSIYIPGYNIYTPPSYTLYISSCKRNHQSSECSNSSVDVTQDTYNHEKIGQYYNG